MNITNIPAPDEALHELMPLTSALYDYFPEAARLARSYFAERELPKDSNRTLLACMIRWEIKEQLEHVGIPVEDEEEDGVFQNVNLPMERLANNGIEGTYNAYRFKILKSDDGSLPTPQSENKCRYYGQQLLLDLGIPPELIRPNVVILWSFDLDYETVHLWLAVPREGGKSRASVKDYYTVPVPHPATTMEPGPSIEPKDTPTEPEITLKTDEIEPPKQVESPESVEKDENKEE